MKPLHSLAIFLLISSAAWAQSTAFTYQGRLKQSDVPHNGTADIQAAMFDAVSGGNQTGPTLTRTGVPVSDGLFSIELDFGANSFDGSDRWLRLSVRIPPSTSYTTLTPRQRVSAAPFAINTRGIAVDSAGRVGVGTENPNAYLHVSGTGTVGSRNHVAFFENTGGNATDDGIAIKIHRAHTSTENNFVTFYNGSDQVTGRIEGFDKDVGDWDAPPAITTPSLSIDFDAGSLPSRVGLDNNWQFPSLNCTGGSLPRLTQTSSGRLPNFTWSSGRAPDLNIDWGQLPDLDITWSSVSIPLGGPTIRFPRAISWSAGRLPRATSWDMGQLPRLSNWDRGSFPSWSLNSGSFPQCSLSPGQLGGIVIEGLRLPSINGFDVQLPTQQELEDLMCWAMENDLGEFLTLDPVSLAAATLKAAVAQRCLDEGVVYGSKGADYAEWLPKQNKEDKFQLGQIVGIHDGKVSLKTEGAEQIMAVSHAPCVLGNLPEEDEVDNFQKVAFMGQIPVVVRGKVEAGDYIVPSGEEDGTAKAISADDLRPEHLDQILGRAWSESTNEIYSMINVVVGVDTHLSARLAEMHGDEIDDLRQENESLKAELASLRAQTLAANDRLEAIESALATFVEEGE